MPKPISFLRRKQRGTCVTTGFTIFFNSKPEQYICIATAHHANDNIETLLINFFRGTGIGGLHGILPKQNKIIRPLLFAKREDILLYATENGLSWTEDSSNATDHYTRNFLRHKVIPLVKEVYPQAEDNLLQNIQRFSEAEILYRQAIEMHKKKPAGNKGKRNTHTRFKAGKIRAFAHHYL